MYRDQKPPESIKTTETYRRTHQITLDTHQVRSILLDAGLRMAGLERTAGVYSDIFIHPGERCPATGESLPTATITITEDLSNPAITDFAPPNIEEIVRLNPPTTPGLSIRLGTGVGYAEINNGNQGKSWGVVPPYTTATPSRENVDANVRMSRITKLHEVLLHGKGNNIVLNRDEVDTMLEIIERSAD